MFALLSQVAADAATLEEIIPILRERERRQELDRVSAARRRAKKQAASKWGGSVRTAIPALPHAPKSTTPTTS